MAEVIEMGKSATMGTAGRAAGLLCCMLAFGCTQTHYRTANLPQEFHAPPVDNPRTIDLSKLASFAVSNELIDRGDVLELTLVTGFDETDSNTLPIRVGDDGAANIPLLGKVELAGLELQSAEQTIAAAGIQRGLFRNPHVTVTMKRQRVNTVTIIGAVNNPGIYQLPRGSSGLLAGLVAAGGLSEEAGSDVEIRRPGKAAMPWQGPGEGPNKLAGYVAGDSAAQPASMRVNLVSAVREGRGGYYLADGDVVSIEKREPTPINVIGLVKKPGQFELPLSRDVRVLDAIALAGGLEIPFADKVYVIRQVPDKAEPVVIQASVNEAKRSGHANLRLMSGDVVSVEETPLTRLYETIRIVNVGLGASVPLF